MEKKRTYTKAIPESLPCGCSAIAGRQYGVQVMTDGTRVCRCGIAWKLVWKRQADRGRTLRAVL